MIMAVRDIFHISMHNQTLYLKLLMTYSLYMGVTINYIGWKYNNYADIMFRVLQRDILRARNNFR